MPTFSKSYKLFYTVLDSLRSSWREFQALHDLGLNVPLLAEILGCGRTMEMASTPPHGAEEAAREVIDRALGNTVQDPIVLSPAHTIHSSVDASFSDTVGHFDDDFPLPPASTAAPTVVGKTAPAGSVAGTLAQRKQARVTILNDLVESWKMKGCTDKFMRYLRLKFNPSQLYAIHTAAEQQGFTLVQGPPGTGKTTTILGILNAIHIREYNQYYKMALEALLGVEGQRCRLQQYEHPWLSLIARLTAAKPRILVVAPSNGAVDNIVLRVMADGFVDGNGGKYYPNIVRVGSRTKSARVKSVSLEDLTDKEMAIANGDLNRLEVLEQFNTQVTGMIKDHAFLQTMLVNLQTAYAQCNPLPCYFELRVDAASGLPVWVDHLTKTTAATPPSLEVVQKRGAQYATIESLPDYILYSHRLTQLVAALDAVSAKRKKVSNMTEAGDRKCAFNMREAVERSVIDGAQILFTTLNSAGQPSMESTEFVVTVVDEAAQVRISIHQRYSPFCGDVLTDFLHYSPL
jgi:energy-coupling factor transporter ATP-binding protein EcfA2